MKLVLKMSGESAAVLGAQSSHSFDHFGGSVGRGEDNSWALPDPGRKLSRKHFAIDFDSGAYWLTDLSSNGVMLNYSVERLEQGRRVRLNNGDHLRLGDYEMDVWVEGAVGAFMDSSATFSSVLMRQDSGAGAASGDAIDSLLDGNPRGGAQPRPSPPPAQMMPQMADLSSRGDPFANPFEIGEDDSLFAPPRRPAPAQAPGAFPDHVPSENQFFQPPAARHVIPDSWDDGADAAPVMPAAPVPQPALPHDWDDEFADLMASPPVAAAPVPVAPAAVSLPAAEPVVAPFAAPEPTPFSAPAPVAPPAPVISPPVMAAPAAPSADADAEALWRLFLEGAGIDPAHVPAGAKPEEAVKAAGALFRVAVAGLRDLLQGRSALKNELHIEQTMVRASGNNPLKFYATAEEALLALVGPPRPGYMPGPAAVREAVSDMKAHEMAMLSGMQETVFTLLDSLDPAAQEQRLASSGGLGGIIPATRKAKCWDAYTQHFAQVAEQCRGDAGTVMGRDFANAYRVQVGKMGED